MKAIQVRGAADEHAQSWFDAIENETRENERKRTAALVHGHGLMGTSARPDKRGKRRERFTRETHRDWW